MNTPSCLHELFAARARRTPDRVAVTDGRQELTYGELDRRAERVARRLRALGVGQEVLVGLCVDRDVDLVVAVLAVLKAGGGYVPLDPRYPAARLAFVLEDCACPVVLGHRRFAGLVGETRFVDLAEAARGDDTATAPVAVHPDSTAYVIHTSGSTGRPKGVVVSHANVARLFEVTRDELGFGAGDTWTLFHSYAFDFSVWELWGALLHGGRLVVVPYPTSRDPEAFLRLVVEQRVTVLNQTPSAFRRLAGAAGAAGWPETALRTVVFGGEALAPDMLADWFDHYGDAAPRLVNMYGITETTVHVTMRQLTHADAGGTASPIGVPLDDLTATIMDERLRPVPEGQPGELYVGGSGVARGYLRRPELTARRFLPDPAGPPGARRYRTGDLVARRGGELEFVGRVDDQIQFRGFRVEPREVEAALEALPGVTGAAVVAREERDGAAYLAGFVATDGAADPDGLRAELTRRLPAHLVPSTIGVLDELPLTTGGKVDRGALRALPTDRPNRTSTSDFEGPVAGLAAIWADVLDVPDVGAGDNFFALGGDSMSAIRVVSLARDANIPISVQGLFQRPVLDELVAYLADSTEAVDASPDWSPTEPAGDVVAEYPASLLQVGILYECEITDDPTLYHDLTAVRLSGPFDPAALRRALDAVSARHDLLRASFDLIGDGEPVQLVHRAAPIPLTTLDVPGSADPAEAVAGWWELQRRQPLEVTEAPLVRCHVLRHADGTYQVALSAHHAVVDGWSFAVLMTDLLRAYDHELSGGRPSSAPPPVVSYRDFVALERRAVADPDTVGYWTALLDSYQPHPLWTDGPGVESTVTVPVDAALSAKVRQLCVRSGVPPKSAYLAAHLWTLGGLTGVPDVLTGIVLNGRPERDGAEDTVGMFVNTLPLRLRVPDGSWRSLVRAVFAAEQAHLPHRRYPLAQLRASTGIRPPDVLFNYADFRPFDRLGELRGIRTHEWWFGDRNQFPLSVTVARRPGSPEWDLVVTAGADHGGRALAEATSRLFLDAVGRMVADPDATVTCG